jgi:hypothetical protein
MERSHHWETKFKKRTYVENRILAIKGTITFDTKR